MRSLHISAILGLVIAMSGFFAAMPNPAVASDQMMAINAGGVIEIGLNEEVVRVWLCDSRSSFAFDDEDCPKPSHPHPTVEEKIKSHYPGYIISRQFLGKARYLGNRWDVIYVLIIMKSKSLK